MAQQPPRLNDEPPTASQDVEDDVSAAQVIVTAALVAALAAALASLLDRSPRPQGRAFADAAREALAGVPVDLSAPLGDVVRRVLMASSDGALVVRRAGLSSVDAALADAVRGLDARVRAGLDAAVGHADADAVTSAVSGVVEGADVAVSDAVTAAHALGAQARADELGAERGRTVRLVWTTAADPCPACAALAGTAHGGPGKGFRLPRGGVVDRPPLHPNCRCWLKVEG